MNKTKRVLAQTICLLTVICLATFAGIITMAAPPITEYTITNPYENEEIDLYTVPAQIAATMTQDPQHNMSVTWTTLDTTLVNPQVAVIANGESKTFNAVKTVRSVSGSNLRSAANVAIIQKAFYTADLTGLSSNTKYTYVCSAQNASGAETYSSKACSFVTAPEGKDEYTFIYLSDTQSSGVNGKAITANTSVFKEKYPNASFIYIAGDLTDTAANEGQWEMFYNQKADSYANTSYVNNNFESAMSDYAIAAIQGNHDNNTFANHLTFPDAGGANITYAYTYGSAHFINLNFEDTASRAAQEAFLRDEVAKAKAAGLWTIVCYHKSLYSGASHIADSDVINARQYWAPILAKLDVDAVLQGHDHVLSRGFVDASGYNGGNTKKTGERTYSADLPANAPLYYVANCASTLKFYSTINYTASIANIICPNYEFLDLNSARAVGHLQNPDGPQTSDSYQGPTYIAVTVSNKAITFDTYMFRYNTSTDTITEAPFLYDSLTVTRAVLEDEVTLEIADVAVAPGGTVDVTYIIKGNSLGFTTLDFELPYNGKIYQPTLITPAPVLGNGSTGVFAANPSFGGKDIIKVSYASNAKVAADGLLFTVTYRVAADALSMDEELNAEVLQAKLALSATNFADINLQVSPGVMVIGILGDIDGNGKITPEDAMLLLQMYVGLIPWTPRALLLGDLNGDGQIDPVDAALILRMVVGG